MVTHFTLIHFYKQTTLRTKAFTQSSFYAQILLRREVCAQRSFTHRRLYAQRLLCKEFFRQRNFYIPIFCVKILCAHALLYTQTDLHRVFTHITFYTEKPLYRTGSTFFFLYKGFNTEKMTHINTHKNYAPKLTQKYFSA